jgi:NAD(P)-dependent dehydrogenase (short-subunit alcohol dehydrogenase family)
MSSDAIRDRMLEGRCAIITGASRGLGFEIAKHYLNAGASVAVCARDAKTLDRAAAELSLLVRPGRSLVAVPADVSRPADVARLLETAVRQFDGLDILVSNAGVIGPVGAIEGIDPVAWMKALEVNVLSSLLLSRAALPHLKRSARGKFVQLSGGGATHPLPGLSAYAASKAAAVRFMETLAEELRPHRIDVNALAPGLLDTRMLDIMLGAGPEVLGAALHDRLVREKGTGATPLGKGAELAVFLGSRLSDGITGRLISAPWDPWRTLPERRAELDGTDIYTLRRIAPTDRGKDWGEMI